MAILIISSKFFSVSFGWMPLSISFAPRLSTIRSMPGSDKLHSALFNPPDEVLPETLPFITSIFNPSLLRLFSKTKDKCCSLGKP